MDGPRYPLGDATQTKPGWPAGLCLYRVPATVDSCPTPTPTPTPGSRR